MLKIHHLGMSQSERIVWLCEELDVPYELLRYDRDPVSRMAPATYKALSTLGTAPVIEDGDLKLGESGAIAEYISRKHANGRFILGPEHPDFAAYLFWFHFANGSMMPGIMMELVAMRFGAPTSHQTSDSRSSRALNALESRLGEAPFLAGDEFTLADVMTFFPLTTMRHFAPRDLTPYSNIKRYLGRVGERPAYKKAMERADPGMPLNLT